MKLLIFLKINLVNFYKIIHSIIQNILKNLGRAYPRFFIFLTPKKLLDYYLKNDLSTHHINGYLKTIIISAKSKLYDNLSDTEKEEYCINQWRTNKGIEWFEKDLRDHKIDEIISERDVIINHLEEFSNANQKFDVICEIGTGDGRFLSMLENRFINFKKLLGVDLNEEFISRNNIVYKNVEKLYFKSGQISQIFEQVLDYAEDSPLLLISVRTLTWFTQTEIERLFFSIAQSKKHIVIAFSEQNEMDLNKEIKSFIRSDIFFHSHNYPFLLKKAGLRIFKKIIKFNNKRTNDHQITIFASNQ